MVYREAVYRKREQKVRWCGPDFPDRNKRSLSQLAFPIPLIHQTLPASPSMFLTPSLIFTLFLPPLVFSQAAPPRSTPLPSTNTICNRSPVDTLCSPSKPEDFLRHFDLSFRGRDPDADGSETEFVEVNIFSQKRRNKYALGRFRTEDEEFPEVIRDRDVGVPCALNGTYIVQVRSRWKFKRNWEVKTEAQEWDLRKLAFSSHYWLLSIRPSTTTSNDPEIRIRTSQNG